MTCIAYDGHSLTVDSMWNDSSVKGTVKKWRKLKDGSIVCICGSLNGGLLLIEWALGGFEPTKFPPFNLERTDQDVIPSTLIHAIPGRGVLEYEGSYLAHELTGKYNAWGSGAEAALGAMHAGASSRHAVAIAARVVPSVGPPFKTFRIRGRS